MNRHTLINAVASIPLCLLACGGSLFVQTGLAATSPLVMQQAAATNSNTAPHQPIQALYKALKEAETSGKTAAKRIAIINPVIDQAFDMDVLLQHSIGPTYYGALTPDEHEQLLAAFRRFTVARYASTFKPGIDAVFSITPTPQPNPSGGVIIHTTLRSVHETANDATPLDYVMQQNAQGWRITDILLNGNISQVAAQRSDFRSALEHGGVQNLVLTLDKKADDFLKE